MWPQMTHIRRCTQVVPIAQAVAALAGGVGVDRRAHLLQVLAVALEGERVAAGAHPLALLGGVVEHRLLDVQHREHLVDHLVRDRAGAADLQHPRALGVDHQLAPPGVDVARGLLVAGAEAAPRRRCRAGAPGRGSAR